jgi:hypothetical protein
MVTVNGVLTIKVINGTYGKFCSGDLNCSLGEFKVKETILDQFEEGRYQGEFDIERFYLSSYIWRGKSTTDIRATVTGVRLDVAEECKVDETQTEPDPVTESVTDAVEAANMAVTKVSIGSSNEAAVAETLGEDAKAPVEGEFVTIPNQGESMPDHESKPDAAALMAIFGDEISALIVQGKTVKLDPTIDRSLFREQRIILKDRGYEFDPLTQTWSRVPSDHQRETEVSHHGNQ